MCMGEDLSLCTGACATDDAEPATQTGFTTQADTDTVQTEACSVNEYASNQNCVSCPPGTSQPAGDTTCDATLATAPTARVTTEPIQDASTQVAPCAYHFDATTATGVSRPFHMLQYLWDFGDALSASWNQGAATRDNVSWDRNTDIGAVAGYVFEEPGDYQVTLTLTDPSGLSGQVTTDVSCLSPGVHFSSANSFCFADISGNGGNFSVCPAGTTHVDTSDFDSAMNQTCNAMNNASRHCSFRRGDTFNQDSGVILRDGGTTPGLVDTFGSNTAAKPVPGFSSWATILIRPTPA
jgi:hypothetical protein